MRRAGDEVRKGGEELGDGDNRNCCWWRSGPWDAKAEVEGEAHGRSGRGIRESKKQEEKRAREEVLRRDYLLTMAGDRGGALGLEQWWGALAARRRRAWGAGGVLRKEKGEQAQMKHTMITKIWKSSEASVSGRYNTPPLQEDLVPRSRMAPGRNGRGRGIEHELDKMKGYLKRGHDTPVEWISTKRTWSSQSEMMSEESNITMLPEERIEDSSLE
ncbi:hypothetical protein VPH35_065859 [Triticum aestivum]